VPRDNPTASNGSGRLDAGSGAVATSDSDPAERTIHDDQCTPRQTDAIEFGSTNDVPPETDLATTRFFIHRYGDRLRFCVEEKKWYIWNEVRWVQDRKGRVILLAKNVSSLIEQEAKRASSEFERDSLKAWAYRSASQHGINAIVELAKTELGIPVLVNELDCDPMLLCVQNGVLDLRTGSLIQPQKNHLITKQARVAYDPTAKCQRWLQFIDEITGGDPELSTYLQRCVGYWLTGLTGEQCFFILFGVGSNGKSVLIRVIQTSMGDYAMSTPPETFMAKRNPGAASPDLARLRAIRLVVAAESSSTSVLDEPLVKQLTGQDIIACRHLYCELFEFLPAFKPILLTNHLPIIRDPGHAIWRRIQAIPFLRIFREEAQDKQLDEKLLAELPGILNWAIAGALEYQKFGLKAPKCVLDAIATYRSDMDVLGDWLNEECEDSPSATTPVKDLYDAYSFWCHREKHTPIGKRNFGDELEKRGYARAKMGGGRVHRGIKLKGVATSQT